MCQAIETEESAIRSSEAFARARGREMDGRMARQAGLPRSGWEALVHRVDHGSPDDRSTLWTPSWWLAHDYDGPLIEAWLSGYDDEGRRIAAGGMPMTRDEREGMSGELAWLYRLRHRLGLEGRRVRLAGDDLSRLLRLKGFADHDAYAAGHWEMPTADARDYVGEAMSRLDAVLQPHVVADRAGAEAA